MRIVVTLELVSNVLRVPRVEHPDYPSCERLRIMSKDEMISTFFECYFLPPHSLVYVSVSMAPKRKYAPSQNSLRSEVLSSSDLTPYSIRFHDEQAQKDFSENFSRRGVHSGRRVILADFTNTNLPNVIHSRGWESLCDVPVTCPSMLI